MLLRKELEEREANLLAPYAMTSRLSRGRKFKEEEHIARSAFQRDRDRIIHCNAFRKLEYKTQVFVNHEGDYYRTRLTHTMEVAQIARTISRILHLNEDLTEAIGLAHDLGHTPFGHAGERTLNELTKDKGGFEHNRQSLRVVEVLEERYPDFPGLNLSWEVREGIIKHTSYHDSPSTRDFNPFERPTLEAQVVDISDEIAYNNHDLDDGLMSGLITEEDLQELELWNFFYKKIYKKYPGLSKETRKYQIIKSIINTQVSDVVQETEKNINKYHIKNIKQIRQVKENIVNYSPQMKKKNTLLKKFLVENLYNHYRVVRMTRKAQRFIQALFETYINYPDQLPFNIQDKLKSESLNQTVLDYIAGMTDRYVLEEYKKLFDPYEKV
ncbi:MAG: deoxyguanosinetriphosphate triphosphohydrolase [Candidatus Firestonebacteria bacterium]|nr:deoxyguanosinetriphosphate triphosphohydrolase [Candidatus Firestonebacteria bacterium]